MTEIFIILLCLLLNAIFSCIEMAFVTVSRAHLKQLSLKGSTSADQVLRLKQNPERVLSVLQIGITLVGAISAAVGGAGAEEHLSPILINQFPIQEETAEYLSIALVVLPLTFISVVIGELVPKSLALKFPMKIALMGGFILHFMDRLFSPFVYMLEYSTKFFTKFIFARLRSEDLVDTSREINLDPLSEAHKRYVFNLIDIDKRKVRDVLVPWENVTTVDISEHYYAVLERIRTSRHTRMPVTEKGEVIGLLHTKEFGAETDVSRIDWTELVRPVVKLKSNQPLLTALRRMQSQKTHLAVVIDDVELLGIITNEDIFEEVVGEIYDEDDDPRILLTSSSKFRTWSKRSK